MRRDWTPPPRAELTGVDVSAFAETLLDDGDAAEALTTLGVSAFVQTIVNDADAAAVRATLELGTIATQDADAVAITGGSVSARLAAGADSELTIAAGSITVTGSYHSVDTEADDATDDLTAIAGGVPGQILILQAASSARTVVVKDAGTLLIAGDCTLDNVEDTITLIANTDATAWRELCRSNNGA
jgi:hypothetical protein